MQEDSRRSNKDRSEAMRSALVAAGRQLFLQRGFAGTGTPDIVAAAGVTRGALYHHFADKTALFEAVLRAEGLQVADEIRAVSCEDGLSVPQVMSAGAAAYLRAMRLPGRARLMLVEAPAVLGPARTAEIDAETGGGTLLEGLRFAQSAGMAPAGRLEETAALLSAAHERAALAVAAGEEIAPWLTALERLIAGALRIG